MWALHPTASVLKREIRKEGDHVNMEAETGGQEPPEVEKTKDNSALEPLEGGQPCRHLDFSLLASRTVVFSHQVCGSLS